MKITIEEREAAQDIEVTIVCVRVDRRVLDIAARLRMLDRKVTGTADGCTRVLSAEDVLFIESVDKHTFIYTADTVLETGLRLYEMEGRLADCDFCASRKVASSTSARSPPSSPTSTAGSSPPWKTVSRSLSRASMRPTSNRSSV